MDGAAIAFEVRSRQAHNLAKAAPRIERHLHELTEVALRRVDQPTRLVDLKVPVAFALDPTERLDAPSPRIVRRHPPLVIGVVERRAQNVERAIGR